MAKTIIPGRVFRVNFNADTSQISRQAKNIYNRIKKEAEFYVVVSTKNGILCAPIRREKMGKAIPFSWQGEVYYVSCYDLPKVRSSWMLDEEITENVSDDVVEQIYARYTQWHDKIKKRQARKREQRRKEDAHYLKVLGKTNKHHFPKEKASSSVSWSMTHPVQGGRTSPK